MVGLMVISRASACSKVIILIQAAVGSHVIAYAQHPAGN